MKKFILSAFGCLAFALLFSFPSFAESLSDNEITFQMDEDYVIDRALDNFDSVSGNNFLLSSDSGSSTFDTSSIEEKLDIIIDCLGFYADGDFNLYDEVTFSSFLGYWVKNSDGDILDRESVLDAFFRNLNVTLIPFLSGIFVALILSYCLPRISKSLRKFFFLRRNSHD